MSKPAGKHAAAPNPAESDIARLEFEQAVSQIESIIDRIEGGEVGLEESLREYERGVLLVAHCRAKLDRAQQQVDDLTRRLEQADEHPEPSAAGAEDDDRNPPAPF
ncbi:MAG: exodeoxyribonuclease VII small subunit [Phycisphaerales bacterium]|nr:exodeoxyribonuclease VII small subunit [Phycisphaerales bacterium]